MDYPELLTSYQVSAPRSAEPLPVSTTLGSDSSAEKLFHEQRLLKADLDLANSKLKKFLEHINFFEEKLLSSGLNIKLQEHQKLCQGLVSKICSVKSLGDQLVETVNALASQVENAEKDKQLIEDNMSAYSAAMDDFSSHLSLMLNDHASLVEKVSLGKLERENTNFPSITQKFCCALSTALLEDKRAVIEHENSKHEKLYQDYWHLKSEKDELQSAYQKINDKVYELQRVEESLLVQQAAKCEHITNLQSEVNALTLKNHENEKLIMELQEKTIQKLLPTEESKLRDAKKQYESMLEKLSKHKKDLSQRNDQEMTKVRNKFELEKKEILSLEKDKAEKAVVEVERNCEQRLEQYKKESDLKLMRIEEEYTMSIKHIQEKYEEKELSLKSNHAEEIKRVELQVETKLRKKMNAILNDIEAHYEAEKLQDQKIDLEKSKEESQKALLQIEWREMADKPQENQEVDSDEDFSCPSVQSPLPNLLTRVEKPNRGLVDISNHGKKVSCPEYEVETNYVGKITKRRRKGAAVVDKGNTGIIHTHPASLYPYADDPYEFK